MFLSMQVVKEQGKRAAAHLFMQLPNEAAELRLLDSRSVVFVVDEAAVCSDSADNCAVACEVVFLIDGKSGVETTELS